MAIPSPTQAQDSALLGVELLLQSDVLEDLVEGIEGSSGRVVFQFEFARLGQQLVRFGLLFDCGYGFLEFLTCLQCGDQCRNLITVKLVKRSHPFLFKLGKPQRRCFFFKSLGDQ